MISKRKLKETLIEEYANLDSFDEFKMIAMTKYGCHISWFNQFSLLYYCYNNTWYDLKRLTYYILTPLLGLSISYDIIYLLMMLFGSSLVSPNLTMVFWISVFSNLIPIFFLCLCNELNILDEDIDNFNFFKNRNKN